MVNWAGSQIISLFLSLELSSHRLSPPHIVDVVYTRTFTFGEYPNLILPCDKYEGGFLDEIPFIVPFLF
jgi:hypothetical protein